MKIQHWPDRAPDPSKPYCLVDSNGTIVGWFATQDDAENAMDSARSRMHGERAYLAPIRRFNENGGWIDDGNERWVQLYPYGSWDHPIYSKTTINREVADKLKESFDNKIKRDKFFSDYEHGMDRAKGSRASGEFLQLEVRDDGLWGLVRFTDEAKKEIDAGEWNYWSTSHHDYWMDPQDTSRSYNYVFDGGALTNSPYVGGMAPLNFSELSMYDLKQFAVWSTAYINDLPDSAFLYIQSGGKKDSEGKTTPRSLRHFPYKDKNGNVDLPHLRNAIARIPQAGSWLSDSLKSSLQAKARRLLGAKNYAEILTIEAEMAPEYFREPGTGFADPEINRDDSADSGSRLDTPPAGEDGSVPSRSDTVTKPGPNNSLEGGNELTPEQIAELRKLLGIGEDVDILETITKMHSDLALLNDLKEQHEGKRQFSEQFPEEYELMQQLQKRDRELSAKQFSEQFADARITRKVGEGDEARDEPTTLGLSGLVVTEIENITKKFSEGNANLEDFKTVMDAIMANGVVDYGTTGSSREKDEPVIPRSDVQGIRKQFSDIITEIAKEDKLDFDRAFRVAAEKHPELYDAWLNNKPAVTTS